ncbi:MAG: putative toxin-antitoxin system toxin component, PIN family [Rhodospirillales bacterium]|nr:putative toxin-antitoxin system toxin component, PIN family [Rhodospirillales bacterium]
MIVVLDCNVVVSACLSDGFVRHVLRHILAVHEMVISMAIIDEYNQVARYPKFAPAFLAVMQETIGAIEGRAHLVEPKPSTMMLPDPADLPYVEAALAGEADLLITGNARHFPDGRYGRTRIVSVREFAEMVELIP